MKQHRLSVLFCFFIFGCSIYAQNIENIKRDPAMWSAEGQGRTIDEADHDALSQIIRQISVSISTQSKESDKNKKEENGNSHSVYTQESSTNSFSFASLQNVEMIVLQPEPNAKVFRWVSKAEVNRMFEERSHKILDFIANGKTAERRLQIDDALRYYYWALMLARSNRDAVYEDFDGERTNCQIFLPLKIKSVISHIDAILENCEFRDDRYYAKVRFTYNGRDISSLQFRYFDGQSFLGPLVIKDGLGELDLISLPTDNKINIIYEYAFRNEAVNLDAELRTIFLENTPPPIDNALIGIPIKFNIKKNTITQKKRHKEVGKEPVTTDTANRLLTPEKATFHKRIEFEQIKNDSKYSDILQVVESAIKQKNPQIAYSCFTQDGYEMFETLLTKTGNITLIGTKQDYQYIQTNSQILGRFCKIKIKFKNGKTFTENITFRFNESDEKINSIAFGLTKKAEDDIFNAASTWTEISRYAILQFMEDYQTAYALKRLDYIEKIFSEDAIIITGTVLKTASRPTIEGMPIDFGRTDVSFSKSNKQQYLTNLRRHFSEREYINLTFEDNQTKVINAPRIPKGTAFAIQINQIYSSPVYADKGYLTLVLDTSKELPIIHVRLWQPERKNMVDLDEFMNKFEF